MRGGGGEGEEVKMGGGGCRSCSLDSITLRSRGGELDEKVMGSAAVARRTLT